MKIAVCSDEPYAVNELVVQYLEKSGHQVFRFGSVQSQKEEAWANATLEAAQAVAENECEQGVFFCWSGTGASIVANKVQGIRAALCTDAETAKAARVWNNANVLVLSNRLTSPDLAKEILSTWLSTAYEGRADEALQCLEAIDRNSIV